MLYRNYKVNKDNIYVGEVVEVGHVYRYRYLNGTSEIETEDYKYLRTMLFILDSNNHADDLLYNSYHYPIFNKSDDIECLKLKSGDIAIRTYYALRDLLTLYKDEVTYEGIKTIIRNFFNGSFYKDTKALQGSNFKKYEFLDRLGNHYPWEVVGNDLKIHAFKPSRREYVKRLK